MLCLCFYQFALFAGYGYAHLLVRCVQVRRQFFFHAILFLAALAVLPVLPDGTWKPLGGTPPGARITVYSGHRYARAMDVEPGGAEFRRERALSPLRSASV